MPWFRFTTRDSLLSLTIEDKLEQLQKYNRKFVLIIEMSMFLSVICEGLGKFG